MSGRRPNGERGAVAVLVAAVLSGGVLFGMGTLTIDVGQLYNEREQLQSGADAASWALAQRCAASATAAACGSQQTLAASLANQNAADGASNVRSICGRGTGLSACPAQTAALSDCQGTAPTGAKYVEVHTSTREANGSSVLPPTFAGILSSSNTGSTLSECSRVAWGPPTTTKVLGIGIGYCDWARMTSNGLVYGAVSSVSNLITGLVGEGLGNVVAQTVGVAPPGSGQDLIFIHDTTGKYAACSSGNPSGYTVPSGFSAGTGFGYLVDATASSCQVNVTLGTTITAYDMQGPVPPPPLATCVNDLYNAYSTGTPVLVPIYDGEANPQVNLWDYQIHISGIAAFVVTGFQLTLVGGVVRAVGSITNTVGRPQCTPGVDRCIKGYFTEATVPSGAASSSTFGTTDYGVRLMSRVG